MTAKYVPGFGPKSKLMIIAEAPGQYEEAEGRPLVGPTGAEVRSLLKECGVELDSVYRTNVFKYRPPNNDFKRAHETGHTVEEGLPQLQAEINSIGPNAILAIGDQALKYTTGKSGINNYRGSILRGLDGKTKVVPSIHPSRLFPRPDRPNLPYRWRYIMRLDFKRAIEESRSPEFNLPHRLLQVASSSLDLHRFLERYSNETLASIDIEVIKCIPVCLGIAFNAGHGISVPLINVPGKFSLPDHEKAEIFRLIDKFFRRPGLRLITQNGKFDHDKLESACRFVVPDPYFDLMLASHSLFPEFPKSLAFLTSIGTREPYYKSELKEYDFKRDKIEDLFMYNAKDVCVPYELYGWLNSEIEEAKLDGFFFEHKMPAHRLYLDLEREGFGYSEARAKELRVKYDALELEYQSRIDSLAGFNVNAKSPKQVALLLYGPDSVAKLPHRSSTDEETLSALLGNHAKNDIQRTLIQSVLAIRQIQKTKSTYINARPDYDGRMRSSYNICGNVEKSHDTGRSSTTLLEPPLRPHKIGLTLHNLTKHSEIGKDVRSVLVCADGELVGNADLSQAEPRTVAVLSEDWDLLTKFDTIDIHRMTAGWFFNLSDEDAQKLDKEDPKRFIGKTGRNGGNYGMGKRRLMETINTDAQKYGIDVSVSEWKAGQILDKFHEKSPKIRGIFQAGIREAIQKHRSLTNPFGNRRLFFDKLDEETYKKGFATIPQYTVIDHLRAAMRRCKARIPGFRICAENHDAFTWISRIEEFESHAKIVKEEMMKPINFKKCTLSRDYDLVIPSDVEYGVNYKDLKKYKGDLVLA